MIKLRDATSPCQRLCVEDCQKAVANLKDEDKTSIAGVCPKFCNICLYMERFRQDDVNWLPQPGDPQYKHLITR